MLEGIQHGTQQVYPGVTAGYPPQVNPQSGIGGPFGGVLGSGGVQGLLGNLIGRQIDPVTSAYLQQAQLQQLQQAQLGHPLGVPSLFGNPLATLGHTFGMQQPWTQMGMGRPTLDPITAAYIQQAQLAHQLGPQSVFGNPLASLIGNPLQNIGQVGGQIGGQIGGPFGSQIGRPLPIGLDPVTAACLQQAQLAQTLGQVGSPFGQIGSPFGLSHYGSQIGRVPFQMGGFPTSGYGQWY